MDLELGEDERALQDGLRSFLDGRFPMAAVRAQADGLDRALWRELADTGVFGLRLPEADGGVGLGMTEAVLVFEELGRSLVAGPVLATHLAAALVTGAASGDTIVGLIERPADVVLVEHLDALDVLLAIDDDGIWTIDPASLTAEPVARPLDPLTPLHRVVDLPQGERLAGADEASTWHRQGATLVAAMLLGMAARSTELAVAYAGEREQFGKPISGFQLTQQKLVDMNLEYTKGVLLALHLGRRKDAGTLRPEQVSLGKLNNVREALDICRTART
ncbi:MAG TPA: acyl-CoA dehydrogenase, partial [Acidimicrobiales bacterium]|nr:acyl-CoA dehydrogenase [Acidimicrobiales bacterium]